MVKKIDFFSQEYKDLLIQRAKDDFEIYNRRRDFRLNEAERRADEEKQRADEAMKKLRNMKEDQLNHIHLIVSRYSLSLDDALDICRIPLDEREEVKEEYFKMLNDRQ